jgi:hypothetical protein
MTGETGSLIIEHDSRYGRTIKNPSSDQDYDDGKDTLSFAIVYGFDDILVEKDKKAARNQSISTCIYKNEIYISIDQKSITHLQRNHYRASSPHTHALLRLRHYV